MELPEITILASQMSTEMVGKKIVEIQVCNEKCLNMPLSRLQKVIVGKEISSVEPRGKWIFMGLNPDYTLLFNTGMGADVIHFDAGDELPEKYQIRLTLEDGSGFTVRVWWFCYLHLVPSDELPKHKLTGALGKTPLEDGFTLDYFNELLAGRRGGIKSFLLNQRNVAGIGNVYIQDILFNTRLHPKRSIPSLTEDEITSLYESMRSVLKESIALGGLAYEKDFYGRNGGYGKEHYKIAYKPGLPCPECGTIIEKIKTGATSSFICPKCQTLD
jgi:formamidopyrimidine-DNA glycosylase